SVTVTSENDVTEIKAGETLQLSAAVEPAKAAIDTIIWKSLDETKATVSDKGLVTALLSGEVTIEAEAVMAGSGLSMKGGFTLTVDMVAPVVDQNDSKKYVKTGEQFSLTVDARGENLTYQWMGQVGRKWGLLLNGGHATLTLTAGDAEATDYYRCTVSNEAGSVNSGIFEVITQIPAIIKQQPQNTAVGALETKTVNVLASGTELTYDWQKYNESTLTWTSFPSDNGNSSYSFGPYPRTTLSGTFKVRCVVSNKVSSVISSTATVSIN
ncbi:MAG: Ig-like domain-containing protein, partial [Bacteroidales bacterium]|nr:Ig-like domain-containing protein [Bacteroidales bacterium]